MFWLTILLYKHEGVSLSKSNLYTLNTVSIVLHKIVKLRSDSECPMLSKRIDILAINYGVDLRRTHPEVYALLRATLV